MKIKKEVLIAITFFLIGVGVMYFYSQIELRNNGQATNLTSVQNNTPYNTLDPTPIIPQESSDSIYDSEVQKVKDEGYTVYDKRNNDHFLLHVLIGMRTGTADGYDKRAFFFYQGKYLGTDTNSISARINSPWRDDKTIALEYTLYKKDEPLCCPTGGSKIVRFQWDGTKLNVLDPIPTDDWDADLSRR